MVYVFSADIGKTGYNNTINIPLTIAIGIIHSSAKDNSCGTSRSTLFSMDQVNIYLLWKDDLFVNHFELFCVDKTGIITKNEANNFTEIESDYLSHSLNSNGLFTTW